MSKSKTAIAVSAGLLVLLSMITACGREEKLNRSESVAKETEISEISVEESALSGDDGVNVAEICSPSTLEGELNDRDTEADFCHSIIKVFAVESIKELVDAINL